MNIPPAMSRRDALKTAALAVVTLPLVGGSSRAADSATPAVAANGREHGLRLGVATYSTRQLSLDDTIATLQVLRIVNAGAFRLHVPWAGTAAQVQDAAAKFHAAGITLSGSGVINLPANEAELRKAFENARAAKLVTMVCKPDVAALPLVEKLVREYDQRIAIHNHGPEDKVYPTPESAFEVIKSLDSRIGLCVDVGHTMRGGADPVADIRRFASRVYDVHLKDSVAVPGAMQDVPVEVGTGRMNIRGILHALLEIKYDGVVAFEYEKAAGNPVTGLAESIGYVRGMLAAVAAARA
jgi:sugar phosphate isomerase/epimerase